MAKFAELKTKKSRHEYVREMLLTNDRWILRGLVAVYEQQTADEQNTEQTNVNNGVGFTGADAELMSSFAKQFINKQGLDIIKNPNPVTVGMFFSPKQEAILRRRIVKYARQLAVIGANNIQQV